MGSNYVGRNEKGFSSASSNSSQSSSARKGKKSGSDKPKQPQRGLGVAQLEKIRLHSQLGCNYLPSIHNPFVPSQEDVRLQSAYSVPSSTSTFSYPAAPYGFPASQGVMIGLPDTDGANRYGDSQHTNVARWHQGNAGFQQCMEPNMTRSFFETRVEGSLNTNKKDRDSVCSGNQNSESSGTQEIDLELRLSL